MKTYFIIIVILGMFTKMGNQANILAFLPYPFYGHSVSFTPIFNALAERGHNVTVVTSFPQKVAVPNLKEIVLPNLTDQIFADSPKDIHSIGSLSFQLIGLWKIGLNGAKIILQNDQVQQLITSNDTKFDLILTETWCLSEPFVAFGHRFNAPIINLSSFFFLPRGSYLSGNHLPASYVPVILHFNFNDHMTFLERVQNSMFYYWDTVAGQYYYLRKQDTIMREHFKYPGSDKLPPLVDMLRHTSLTLMEYHHAIGYNVPLHRNVVTFAGVNTKKPDRLPQDIKTYLDNATEGVIYFSLGSYVHVDALKSHIIEAIVSTLRQIKHKMIVKIDDHYLIKNISGNVNLFIKNWLPQRSILAHENCKLFITHGGLHGMMEGVYHAVPMIVIPFLGDQRFNARFIETNGIGINLPTDYLTSSTILQAVDKILEDPSYRQNINKRSKILRDNPMDSMENVMYWIEYVIRYNGAPHLRPAVLDLYWYQVLMLDVIAFYLMLLIIAIYITKLITLTLFKIITWLFCLRNNCTKGNTRKNKKD